MNFLAHLYLSRNDEEIMVGNILADFSKGTRLKHISENIKKGIEIHREIDRFTDTHEIVRQTKKRLHHKFNHYSPVIADVYFDHFLASEWEKYSERNLYSFADKAYNALKKHRLLFPLRFQHALVYGRFRKVLVSYATIEGIDKAFRRMTFRTRFESKLEIASTELSENYDLYHADFKTFFPELKRFAESL